MVYVGDIYIQTVSELNSKSGDREVTEVNGINLLSSIAPPKSVKIGNFAMKGAVYTEDDITDDVYAENVDAIKERTGAYNYIKCQDTDGFIEVTSSDVPKTADMANEREYTMSGKFMPSAQYERTYVLNTEQTLALNNTIVHGIPPYVSLPIGAKNVKVKSPYQTLNVSKPSYYLESPDGLIPIYQPFPVLSPTYNELYEHAISVGGGVVYDTKYYNMCCAVLDCKKSAGVDVIEVYTLYVGIDIPRGTYKLVFKMKYESESTTVVSTNKMIVQVYGETFDGQKREVTSREFFTPKPIWDMYECEMEVEVTDFDEKITINLQSNKFSDKLYIEYAYLVPTYLARMSYEVEEEPIQEVYVYDVVNGVRNRVHSKNHIFEGTIYVGNSLHYWVLDPTQYWENTGYMIDSLDSISNLKLYPYAFSRDKPKIMFTSILPDEVKFQIICDVGLKNKTKMITDVSVLTYSFMFDVHKINQFHYDWIMTANEQYSDFNYYNNTFTVKDSTGANVVVTAADTMYCYFKYGSSLCQLSKNTNYNYVVDNRGKVFINGGVENDNDYKFMFSMIPLVTPSTCYADNIYAASDGVGGLRGQPFTSDGKMKRENFVEYYPTNTAEYTDDSIIMSQNKGSISLLELKNRKYNECRISIKSKILIG